MLFEKVPGFYGSGVIPSRFEDFKEGIQSLIMQQFFTQENITRFFHESAQKSPDLSPLIDSVDLSPSFEALKDSVMKSKLGAALNMFGGASALDPIQPKFISEMRKAVKSITGSDDFQQKLQKLISGSGDHSALLERVNLIVEKRLEELSPQMVKNIIQHMIRTHLGWLVVWGGVCGGLIGLAASLITLLS